MAARKCLPRIIAFESQIFNNSIEIRFKNAVHLGEKFLATIFSAINYYQFIPTIYKDSFKEKYRNLKLRLLTNPPSKANQCLIALLKAATFGSVFIWSLRVLQGRLPLKNITLSFNFYSTNRNKHTFIES